jgi:hypothetical protein
MLGFRARSETGVMPTRANQRIHHELKIPLDSRDVDYYSTVIYSIADFSISRDSFSVWAETRGWQLSEVSQDDFTYFRYAVNKPAEPTIIESGLVFNAMDEDLGFSGAYNDATARATLSFSTR